MSQWLLNKGRLAITPTRKSPSLGAAQWPSSCGKQAGSTIAAASWQPCEAMWQLLLPQANCWAPCRAEHEAKFCTGRRRRCSSKIRNVARMVGCKTFSPPSLPLLLEHCTADKGVSNNPSTIFSLKSYLFRKRLIQVKNKTAGTRTWQEYPKTPQDQVSLDSNFHWVWSLSHSPVNYGSSFKSGTTVTSKIVTRFEIFCLWMATNSKFNKLPQGKKGTLYAVILQLWCINTDVTI